MDAPESGAGGRGAGRVGMVTTPDELVIEAPGAHNRVWTIAAALFGVPWLVFILVASVWYVGWGVPDGWFVRALLWLVMMLLTIALHVLALLSLWAAVYARVGTETLTIGPQRITLVRRAWHIPIELHIRRSIIERAERLPERPGTMSHPRVEVKSWRSAVRFGAGLDSIEAGACVAALNAFFERAEAERHALTPDDAGATIARTRPEGRGHDQATTGTSRAAIGLSQRAGTVKARGVRRFRKSPPSFGPNGRGAK